MSSNNSNRSILSSREQRLLHLWHHKRPISRDINQEFADKASFGDRLADRVAKFGGSWTFIMLFVAMLIGWIVLNSVILVRGNMAFDPYPYILLNLCLSMVTALQAPIIMMSQNRQATKDRLDAGHDYEVNLKAELEIAALHEKIDQLREQQWEALLAIQQEQIRLLSNLNEQRQNSL